MSKRDTDGRRVETTAAYVAEQICLGFQYHDRNEREKAIEAFSVVDRHQFRHIGEREAKRASEAYVDALWAKDAVEDEHKEGGELNRETLAKADWSGVEDAFAERADIAGIDSRYAKRSTIGWRNHKTGNDYWTPIQEAQVYELRAALQDADYPDKPKYGQAGCGPEAMRYALAVELHDMHSEAHWEQATQVMQPYFELILSAHRDERR